MGVAQHRKFDLGMNQDEASHLLGEGYVYYARNFLFDKIGIPRKRGGATGVGASAAYTGDRLGALTMDDGTARFYCSTSAAVAYVNTGTGTETAFTLTGGFNAAGNLDGGRPFQHYGFLVWPNFQNNASDITPVAVAGATGAKADRTFAVPGGVALTAGDPRVTCNVADSPTTLMEVGQIIVVMYGAGTQAYFGRVTHLISTTAFEVYPTPTVPGVGSKVYTVNALDPFNQGGYNAGSPQAFITGKVGMSFQGRVVLGNIGRVTVAPAVRQEVYPRRVWFSTTLLEQDASGHSTYQGAVWLTPNGFPDLNYFDIPAQEAVTALTPTGFGDALIFTPFRTYRLTGNLTTQFGLQQSITWAPREIPNSVGCMSERSIQRTPRGVIFAHDSGIYTTDGTSMQPLMYRRMATYWNSLVKAGITIYGSGLIRGNHYYICGNSGAAPFGLMVNLDTLAWGTISGKAAAPASWLVNSAVQDPATSSRCWGLKYDTSVGATHTGGQLVKLDDMFTPTSANQLDSDTTPVSFDLITRPYNEDSPGIQKVWRDATIDFNNQDGQSVFCIPGFVLDSADLISALSSTATVLDPQDVYTVTAATNVGPIVLTIGAHGLNPDTWVRVVGVTGNTAANGPWRIQAASATTITLMGSVGNGAYVSGGTVRALDQRDISLLNQQKISTATGQNNDAVAYRIYDFAGTGADSFELLGITHTWDDRDPSSE